MFRVIGYSAYETKDYEKALTNMNTFFQKEKDSTMLIPEDYLYYAKIYTALAVQDSTKTEAYLSNAETNFNKALALDTAKDKSKTLHEIADGYKDAKFYGKAGEWYGKIIAANPSAPALDYYYWGFWNYYGKNYDVSEKAFKAMIAKYPGEGSALYWLARVEAAKDSDAKTGLAVQAYKDWLAFEADGYTKEDQQLMYAYQYLAYYYYNQNQSTECMEWANKILEKDPNNTFAKQLVDYFKAKKESAQKSTKS
jgi:tetratricopeptide (TPR) repeat protein